LIRRGVARGQLPADAIRDHFDKLGSDPRWAGQLRGLIDFIHRTDPNRLPRQALIEVLRAAEAGDERTVAEWVERFDFRADPDQPDLIDLGKGLETNPPRRPCRPVDLGQLEPILTAAIDPTADGALVKDRVLDGIDGLGAQPLAVTEICPGLDYTV